MLMEAVNDLVKGGDTIEQQGFGRLRLTTPGSVAPPLARP